MTSQRQRAVFILGLCILAGGVGEAQYSPADAITASRVRGHMRFLAHDLLEGREPGKRGFDVAAAYVAAQYEGMGLDPLESGSHFQEVPLRRAIPLDSTLEIRAGETSIGLEAEHDFVIGGHPTRETYEVEAEIVFVGYGIRAPEFGHDDYEAVDVEGKIVAFLDGVPDSLPEPVRGYFRFGTEKRRAAAERGAVSTISLMTPETEKRRSWEDTVSYVKKGWFGWLDKYPDSTPPWAAITLSGSGAEKLFRAAGQDWHKALAQAQDGRSRKGALGLRASLRATTKHVDIRSRNVVGVLRGRGPHRDQYVVYTAHLDHVGVGEPVDGDAIYNGAVDNASGVAALLCVAEAFTRLPTPPARSMVFLATTAEEPGLFGSDYFVRRGPIPRKRIVAALNIDGATLMVHPLLDVSAMGASDSTLGEAALAAGKNTGLKVRPEGLPLLGSDHFPFAKAGIPALWTIAGKETGRDDLDGTSLQREFMQTRLHTPQDDMEQSLDFQAAADLAAFNFAVGGLIANAQTVPMWDEETIVGRFLKKRGPGAESRQ